MHSSTVIINKLQGSGNNGYGNYLEICNSRHNRIQNLRCREIIGNFYSIYVVL